MIFPTHYSDGRQWEYHLLVLSALIAVGCFGYLWSNPRPLSVPQVALPLAVSLVIGGYAVRLTLRDTLREKVRPMVRYGWMGALFAVALGVGELALYLSSGLPTGLFSDMVLTFLSIGIITGVVTALFSTDAPQDPAAPDREPVLAETTWTGRSSSSPILSAIVDALAEVEDVESTDLEPIYDHVEPSVFDNLNANRGSTWEFIFNTDDYAIRISSYGTVTVSNHSSMWETDGS